jgi:hypothetical protein
VRAVQVCAAVATIGTAAGVASADRVVLNGGLGYGGGPFTAQVTREAGLIGSNAAPFSPFPGASESTLNLTTFCVEVGEFFSPGEAYFAEYSLSASAGGVGGADPLSTQTAWLFSRAVADQGALTGVLGAAFNAGNVGHGRAVQEAVWALEGESFALSGGTVGAWRDALISLANANANGSLYGVMIMRLWDQRTWNSGAGGWAFGGNHQDQLVYTQIPLPPAAWAGLGTIAAVIGFGYIRRRSLRSEHT